MQIEQGTAGTFERKRPSDRDGYFVFSVDGNVQDWDLSGSISHCWTCLGKVLSCATFCSKLITCNVHALHVSQFLTSPRALLRCGPNFCAHCLIQASNPKNIELNNLEDTPESS